LLSTESPEEANYIKHTKFNNYQNTGSFFYRLTSHRRKSVYAGICRKICGTSKK